MLNGEERFVVVSISRTDIATMINDVIDEKHLAIPLFDHGDARLTSRVCGEVAEGLADLYDRGLSEEDLGAEQRNVVYQVMSRHFL